MDIVEKERQRQWSFRILFNGEIYHVYSGFRPLCFFPTLVEDKGYWYIVEWNVFDIICHYSRRDCRLGR